MQKYLIASIGILLLISSPSFGQFPEPAEEDEFEQILTASSFNNWEGNTDYWRFEDDILIGETSEDNPLEENTFLIWKEKISDFELKVEYKITGEGNSGINYRSQKVDGIDHALQGYQADFDGANQWSGQVYEERGRGFLALRGQITHVGKDDEPVEIGSVGEEDDLTSVINQTGWNEYHLIAKGNTLVHLLNGRVMSIVIDDGGQKALEGLLGVQIHTGPPMKVKYRNMRLKQL